MTAATRAELVRHLAVMMAADVREFPDAPLAEVSVTSRTRSDRRRADRIVTGRLHAGPTVPPLEGPPQP
jgi:hypothetical protein